MKIEPKVYDGTSVFFNLFRRELAIAAQIIEPKAYFGTPDDGIDWKAITKMTDYFGYWVTEPKDPVWYLLAHSDCDGIITLDQMKLLIPRLLNIRHELSGKDNYPNWEKYCGEFAKKMSNALAEEKVLQFK